MNNHIHKFSVDSKRPKIGGRPFSPFLRITLVDYSTSQNGIIEISSKLMSHNEIDSNIDLLIEDLERIRRLAKREI